MIEDKDSYEVQEIVVSRKPIIKSFSEQDDLFNLPFKEFKNYHGLSKIGSKRYQNKLVKSFSGIDGAKTKQIEVDGLTAYSYLDCVTPPFNMEYLAKLYEISPAHHAAVNAKVESVYGLGYDWVESTKTKNIKSSKKTDAQRKKIDKALEQSKEMLEQWLEDINKDDTFDEIMKKVGKDYESTGNAYIEIGRTANGKVGYVGHVPSSFVRIRRNRDGFIQMFGAQFIYFRNFGEFTDNPIGNDPNPNELIHIKNYSPTNNYYGIPDIIAAKSSLAGNEFASRYNLDYFENKAIPRHIIIVKGASLSQLSTSKLVEFFETGLRGQHHRSLLVPLPPGSTDASIEFKSIEAQTQDQSFGGYREANNEEIFMAHRIPASRAGVFTKDVSLAASRDADKVFKESYSRPMQAIFEKKMRPVFRTITDMYDFKLNELSLTDADTQSKIDERDIRNQIKVADEVRAERGLKPRPDGKGEQPFSASSQQAADMKANANKTRKRDAERSSSSPDSVNSDTGRSAKGDGRSVQ